MIGSFQLMVQLSDSYKLWSENMKITTFQLMVVRGICKHVDYLSRKTIYIQ